ncbi:alpha/beta hydrolase family protein [Micromonospora sp. NPDC005113]
MGLTSSIDVRLVSTAAADGRALDGLLYEPADEVVASVLHLHGKGGNCYSGPGRFVPALMAGTPVRHLSLNMRCHDLGYSRPDHPAVDLRPGASLSADGGAWELVAEGLQDVGAGVRVLRDLGDQPVFVSGHSSGGFYAAAYGATDPQLAGRILLSPLVSNKRPLRFWFGGPEGVQRALDEARAMVARGDGDLLIALPSWYYGISAASLLERAAEPDDSWIQSVEANRSPVLVLWGGAESRAGEWRVLFEQMSVAGKEMVAVPDAEHNYLGFESSVTAAVAVFLLAPR